MRRLGTQNRLPLGLVIWAVLSSGCAAGPVTVKMDAMRPAEVDLGNVRRVAVADFQGAGGSAVSGRLVTKLLAGRRFDILERTHLARVIDELALSQSGILDAATAAKVGKAAGVDALMFGEVHTYQVADEWGVTPLQKIRVVGYQTQCDRKGRCYNVPVNQSYTVNAPTTIRRGHVNISFRVVSVESGQVLAAKTASRRWEGINVVDPDPGSQRDFGKADPMAMSMTLPAMSAILEHLADEVASEMAGLISPLRVQVELIWVPAEQTEPALKYLNAGLPKEAQEHLEGMLQRAASLSPPFYYDLGVVYEVNGRLDDAEAMYKKAATLEMNDVYLKAISSVRQAREARRRLTEQQRTVQ